jgi:DUF971 family protein
MVPRVRSEPSFFDGSARAQAARSTKKRGLAVIQNTIEEQLELKEIWAVGQYALGMRWGDGHDSGIYPFSLLFELGKRP